MHGHTAAAADGSEEDYQHYEGGAGAMGSYRTTNLTRKPGSIGELEDLVREMDADQGMGSFLHDGEVQEGTEAELDVYSQLERKEHDLLLAAELGKALLEKNQELKKKNEQMTEEIEVLTQERHKYKLKFESKETEFDSMVREFQGEVGVAEQALQQQQQQSEQGDRSRSQIVQELTRQNERLTEQLRKAQQTEEHLQTQVDSLRQQVRSRRLSMNEHLSQVEILKEEISLFTDHRQDTEKRMGALIEERDALQSNQEELQGRVHMLERQLREQAQQSRQSERICTEVQEQNGRLQDRLDEMTHQYATGGSILDSSTSSLMSELEASSQNGGASEPCSNNNNTQQLHLELAEVYRHLCRLVNNLRSTESTDSTPPGDEECPDDVISTSGLLLLLHQLEEFLQRQQNTICETGSEGSSIEMQVLESNVISLQQELDNALSTVVKLNGDVKLRDEKLQNRADEVEALNSKVTSNQEELTALREERDRLQDMAAGITTPDEVLQQTREERDEVHTKLGHTEKELVTSRIDVSALERQLMDAIDQKLKLSQQLEQWQVDMHELIDARLQRQMKPAAEKSPKKIISPSPPKRRSFFKRS